MRKRRLVQLTAATCLIALVLPMAQSWAANHAHQDAKAPALTLEQLYTKQLPLLSKSLAEARKAVQMGHKQHALAELTKVENHLAIVHQTLGKHVQPAFINTACPIMGAKINPAEVKASLVRDYNGKKVAFCCAGCPSAWDKLSNSQKQAKLAKVMPPQPMHHNH